MLEELVAATNFLEKSCPPNVIKTPFGDSSKPKTSKKTSPPSQRPISDDPEKPHPHRSLPTILSTSRPSSSPKPPHASSSSSLPAWKADAARDEKLASYNTAEATAQFLKSSTEAVFGLINSFRVEESLEEPPSTVPTLDSSRRCKPKPEKSPVSRSLPDSDSSRTDEEAPRFCSQPSSRSPPLGGKRVAQHMDGLNVEDLLLAFQQDCNRTYGSETMESSPSSKVRSDEDEFEARPRLDASASGPPPPVTCVRGKSCFEQIPKPFDASSGGFSVVVNDACVLLGNFRDLSVVDLYSGSSQTIACSGSFPIPERVIVCASYFSFIYAISCDSCVYYINLDTPVWCSIPILGGPVFGPASHFRVAPQSSDLFRTNERGNFLMPSRSNFPPCSITMNIASNMLIVIWTTSNPDYSITNVAKDPSSLDSSASQKFDSGVVSPDVMSSENEEDVLSRKGSGLAVIENESVLMNLENQGFSISKQYCMLRILDLTSSQRNFVWYDYDHALSHIIFDCGHTADVISSHEVFISGNCKFSTDPENSPFLLRCFVLDLKTMKVTTLTNYGVDIPNYLLGYSTTVIEGEYFILGGFLVPAQNSAGSEQAIIHFNRDIFVYRNGGFSCVEKLPGPVCFHSSLSIHSDICILGGYCPPPHASPQDMIYHYEKFDRFADTSESSRYRFHGYQHKPQPHYGVSSSSPICGASFKSGSHHQSFTTPSSPSSSSPSFVPFFQRHYEDSYGYAKQYPQHPMKKSRLNCLLNSSSSLKKASRKKRFDSQCASVLESYFGHTKFPSQDEMERLAETVDADFPRVKNWFQNRRQKLRVASSVK